MVAVLEHNSFEVVVPRQGCCGLPLQSSGLFDDARRAVSRLARRLEAQLIDEETPIVGNATSCTPMLKREAREILGLEHDQVLARVAERTHDVGELLLDCHHRSVVHGIPQVGPCDRMASLMESRRTHVAMKLGATHMPGRTRPDVAVTVAAALCGAHER